MLEKKEQIHRVKLPTIKNCNQLCLLYAADLRAIKLLLVLRGENLRVSLLRFPMLRERERDGRTILHLSTTEVEKNAPHSLL
jgi:hypothetical protein